MAVVGLGWLGLGLRKDGLGFICVVLEGRVIRGIGRKVIMFKFSFELIDSLNYLKTIIISSINQITDLSSI